MPSTPFNLHGDGVAHLNPGHTQFPSCPPPSPSSWWSCLPTSSTTRYVDSIVDDVDSSIDNVDSSVDNVDSSVDDVDSEC